MKERLEHLIKNVSLAAACATATVLYGVEACQNEDSISAICGVGSYLQFLPYFGNILENGFNKYTDKHILSGALKNERIDIYFQISAASTLGLAILTHFFN